MLPRRSLRDCGDGNGCFDFVPFMMTVYLALILIATLAAIHRPTDRRRDCGGRWLL